MPGKLPGGKIRVSRSVPPLSTVADPTNTEVKYFGLTRDDALSDLESSKDALQEVLKDIQSVSERETEGLFNIRDVSVLDGIENFGISREDIAPLKGASLTDGEGEAIIKPRQRLQDRIAHFESFAGRGTPFIGSGPVKYVYYAPPVGTELPGTASVAANGTITGTATNFNGSTGASDPFTPHVLSTGDYINAYNNKGERVGRYKVSSVSSQTVMAVTNAEAGSITAISNVTLKVVYSHTSPPPFFTESITSTAFNAPDNIPNLSQVELSHRIGDTSTGLFKPKKYKEDWWEGNYERSFNTVAGGTDPAFIYGEDGENADNNPVFNIIKDGNKNYELLADEFIEGRNLGIRYDFLFRKEFTGQFFKWAVQKFGEVKIDMYKQTGVDGNGDPEGSWINVLDTTDESTYHVFVDKASNTDNFLKFREVYMNGGSNFGATATTSEAAFLDTRDTYTDEEDNEVSAFNNEFVPVVIRYWYGQDTFDNTITDENEKGRLTPAPRGGTPSINIQLKGFDLATVPITGTISDLTTAGEVTGSGTAFNTELAVGSRITINSVSYKVTAIDNNNNTSLTVRNPTEDNFTSQSYTATTDRTHKQAWNNYYTHIKGVYSTTNGEVTLDSTYTGAGTETNLDNINMNGRFDIVAYIISGNAPTGLSTTKNILNYRSEYQKYTYGPSQGDFYEGTRVGDGGSPAAWTDDTFTVSGGLNIPDNAVVHMMIQNNPYKLGPPKLLPAASSSANKDSTTLWVEYIFHPDKEGEYTGAGDLISDGGNFSQIDPKKQALEERSSYFAYKYGALPQKNFYGSDRYSGFLENSITTLNTDRDYDYNHNKLLAIGRQKKGTATGSGAIGTTSPMDGKDLATGETRPDGSNYTFLMYEADEYNNGGRVQILAGPVNSLAAIFAPTDAGANTSSDLGKILHSTDNVGTFSNTNKQNLTAATTIVTQPASTDTYNIYQEEFLGGPILVARGSTSAGDYEAVWSTSNMGASAKNFNDKTFFLAYVSQNGDANAYFRELINAERPSVKASSITLTGGGQTPSIQDGALFAADSSNGDRGSTVTNQNNVPYIKSRVALYASTDSAYATVLAEYEVTSYTASSTTVALNRITGTNQAAGTYRAIIYYNYLKLPQALHTLDWTDANGIAKTTDSIGNNPEYSGTSNNMVINGVYSTSATYSRVDNGSTLSFGDALLVEPGSDTSSALNPYSAQTELPFPPSGAVTPFGFDRSSSDTNNPGSGGICYPPIDAPADSVLSALAIEDSDLYGRSGGTLRKTEGHYDTYFGGKSLTNIGSASITVTRGLVFDFPSGSYDDIITTPTSDLLPKFSADSYTHKIRVELTPYIGAPDPTFANATGLFSRSDLYNNPTEANPLTSSDQNPYIYNDVTIYYSTLEPVKEALYLFARASSANPTSETDISLISISSVTFT